MFFPNRGLTLMSYANILAAIQNPHLEIQDDWFTPDIYAEEDHQGNTLLHHAAMCGRTEIARRLLTGGAVVDARSHCQATPLHFAAVNNRNDIVDLFLQNNADINAQDNIRQTPLMWALRSGSTRGAMHLLDLEAETASCITVEQQETLPVIQSITQIAVWNGHYATAKALFSREGANRENAILAFTLPFAIIAENIEAVRAIGLEQGTDNPTCLRPHGGPHTALFIAASTGWVKGFRTLINESTDPLLNDETTEENRNYIVRFAAEHEIPLVNVPGQANTLAPTPGTPHARIMEPLPTYAIGLLIITLPIWIIPALLIAAAIRIQRWWALRNGYAPLDDSALRPNTTELPPRLYPNPPENTPQGPEPSQQHTQAASAPAFTQTEAASGHRERPPTPPK